MSENIRLLENLFTRWDRLLSLFDHLARIMIE